MLPFILLGAALVAGGVGVAAADDGISNIKKAKETVERAQRKYNRKKEEVENQLKVVNKTLSQLGELYSEIYTKDFKELVNFLKKLGSELEIKDLPAEFNYWQQELPNLENSINVFEKAIEGAVKGVVKGGLTAVLTHAAVTGLAIQIGTASTGTALASLSGAALENALLAWFGGGSLAAGGLGMAGGAFVLGGIVAGPALLIGGITLSKKGEEALTQAKEFEQKVEREIAKQTIFEKNLKLVGEKAREEISILKELRKRFLDRFGITTVLYYTHRFTGFFEEKFHKNFQMTLMLGKTIREITKTPWVENTETFEPNKEKLKLLERAKQLI
jgi:hypothetical protein